MAASFRDPAGRVLMVDGRVLRFINNSGIDAFQSFLASDTSQNFLNNNSLVQAFILDTAKLSELQENVEAQSLFQELDGGLLVEHERVPFPSFPYEWAPEMLHRAATLTLDLAESLLTENFGLKDATPYNILFRGPAPVFVDWLSVERRHPNNSTWLAYAQFTRTFLLPLLANKYFALPLDQLLIAHRDGLEPETIYRLCGPLKKLHPRFLDLVSLPTWFASRSVRHEQTLYGERFYSSAEQARFVLKWQFKRLRQHLRKLAPPVNKASAWSDYAFNIHTENYTLEKRAFVESVLRELGPRSVLDIGCNTGYCSAIAARYGARVVAIDQDSEVIGETWRMAINEDLDILPLVVNIARPSPSVGWRNQECQSFLDRARGAFDAVLMLAIVHHMLVTERIPLEQILELSAELTTDALVIEFIAPDDPMFRHLARGRDELCRDLTQQSFELECRRFFEIARCWRLAESNRWLYLLRRKQAR
jgi:SAM-dependent methyltransferase